MNSAFPDAVLNQIKALSKEYVGVRGLTQSQAAQVINTKLKLRERYKTNLTKNMVIGHCQRAGATKASVLDEVGKKLLLEAGLPILPPKPKHDRRTTRPHQNGTANKLKQAKLRKEPKKADEPITTAEEIQETATKKAPSFVTARERRLRGVTHLDPDAGRHWPDPKDGVSHHDAKYMEQFFARQLTSA